MAKYLKKQAQRDIVGLMGGCETYTDRWVEANPREPQCQTRSGEPQEVLEQGRDTLRNQVGKWQGAGQEAGRLLTALPQPLFAFLMDPVKRLVSLLAQLALADKWDSAWGSFRRMALPTDLGAGSFCSHPPLLPNMHTLSLSPPLFSRLVQGNDLPVCKPLSR